MATATVTVSCTYPAALDLDALAQRIDAALRGAGLGDVFLVVATDPA